MFSILSNLASLIENVKLNFMYQGRFICPPYRATFLRKTRTSKHLRKHCRNFFVKTPKKILQKIFLMSVFFSSYMGGGQINLPIITGLLTFLLFLSKKVQYKRVFFLKYISIKLENCKIKYILRLFFM